MQQLKYNCQFINIKKRCAFLKKLGSKYIIDNLRLKNREIKKKIIEQKMTFQKY